MKINADVTLTIRDETQNVVMTFRDRDAATTFMEVKMTAQQFMSGLGRLACIPVDVEVFNLNRLNKKLKLDQIEFRMPDDVDYQNEKEMAAQLAIQYCPAGWTPDLYFSSQGSFFYKKEDGMNKRWARTTIRSWVDKEDAHDSE